MDDEHPEEGGLPLDFFCHVNKFPAGVNYITEGAEKALAESGEEPLPFLCAHLEGNWGYVGAADRSHNDCAVKNGGEILSEYRTKKDATILVVTKADRSATTIMVPDEY
jgi:hypothetical protein